MTLGSGPILEVESNAAQARRAGLHCHVGKLARLPAESGTWGERAAAIEQVLDGRAIAPLELEAWMRIVEQRHEVRLLGMGRRDDGS